MGKKHGNGHGGGHGGGSIPTYTPPPTHSGGGSSSGGGPKTGGTKTPAGSGGGANAALNYAKQQQAAADARAKNGYLDTARILQQQVDALRQALGPDGFKKALDVKLANIKLAQHQQDKALVREYRDRVGSLAGAEADNQKATNDQSYANLANRGRERASALSEAMANGAGESDMLRAQQMSLNNWNANQSEVNRSYHDTLRSINSSLTDLTADTRTARINNVMSSNSDREQLWTNYYNQRSETATQLGNVLGQQAQALANANNIGGGGGGGGGKSSPAASVVSGNGVGNGGGNGGGGKKVTTTVLAAKNGNGGPKNGGPKNGGPKNGGPKDGHVKNPASNPSSLLHTGFGQQWGAGGGAHQYDNLGNVSLSGGPKQGNGGNGGGNGGGGPSAPGGGSMSENSKSNASGDAFMAATNAASKAWKSPGVSSQLMNWKGHGDFESALNNSRVGSAASATVAKRPEGATLRKW